MRGLFVLHASSVNMNGSAIAFSGFKGYGKSTTAMAFYNQGYSVVADDYIIIDFDIIMFLLFLQDFQVLDCQMNQEKLWVLINLI